MPFLKGRGLPPRVKGVCDFKSVQLMTQPGEADASLGTLALTNTGSQKTVKDMGNWQKWQTVTHIGGTGYEVTQEGQG